ncbi:MAG TPA: flagellar protein FlaG [Clostridia bacterium]|nr:flagellar protein FlaG [Clostridia bacterium]
MRVDGLTASSSIQSSRPVVGLKVEQNNVGLGEKQQLAVEQSQGHEQKKVTEEELIGAIEKANKKMEIYNTCLEFSIHEATKEIMIKVIDTVKEEVIREIPPEKILDMVAKMMEMAGLLVDERA